MAASEASKAGAGVGGPAVGAGGVTAGPTSDETDGTFDAQTAALVLLADIHFSRRRLPTTERAALKIVNSYLARTGPRPARAREAAAADPSWPRKVAAILAEAGKRRRRAMANFGDWTPAPSPPLVEPQPEYRGLSGEQRYFEAVKLREQGLSYLKIAKALGYASPQGARRAVMRGRELLQRREQELQERQADATAQADESSDA